MSESVRLEDLTIGYEFSGEWMKRIGMTRLQPYFSAQNLFTLTKYLGMDPEVNQNGNSGTVQGLDYGTYPYVTSSSPTAAGVCEGAVERWRELVLRSGVGDEEN